MANSNTKRITPKQYADWKGCTLQNITKHLRNNKDLEYVITVIKYSRFYLLEVPQDLNAQSFETDL